MQRSWVVRLLIVGTCGLFLALFASASAQAALPAGVTVSVGYYDNEHGPNTPPTDWGASTASVTFLGSPLVPSTRGTYDSGGIRFDNSTAAPIKLDSVVVNIGPTQYNGSNQLWAPAQLTIPASGSLILANPGPTSHFDTSDYHCGGNPPSGVRDGIIPQIIVTQGGTPTSYADTTQVLTYDCTKPETHNWLPIATGGPPPPPPAPAITAPADGSYNNTGSVTLTGRAQASSTVKVYDGASTSPAGTSTTNVSGNWTKALTGVPDGTHAYTAAATDAANQTGARSSPAIHVTVDTHAPAPPSITAPADGSFNNTGSVTLTGHAEASSTVKVYDGSTLRGTSTANGSGNWTQALTGVPDGTHAYTATATDAAANTSGPSPVTHVTVNTHVPVITPVTSITSGPAGSTSHTSASFTFVSSKTGSTFQCRLLGPGSRGSFNACSSPARFTRLAHGSYTFTVRATDRSGNVDPSPPSRRFTVLARSTSTHAVTSLGLSPTKFRAASGGPSAAAGRAGIGTTVTFTLTVPGTVRFTLEKRLAGRHTHGRCVAASSHNLRDPVCTRYRHLTGSFGRIGLAGSNQFHFTGRMGGLALVPGRYRLLADLGTGPGMGTPFRIKR